MTQCAAVQSKRGAEEAKDEVGSFMKQEVGMVNDDNETIAVRYKKSDQANETDDECKELWGRDRILLSAE